MSHAITTISSSPQLTVTLGQRSALEPNVKEATEKNYQEAFRNLLLEALAVNSQSAPALVQGVYACAIELLPHLSVEQVEKELYPKVFEPLTGFCSFD